MGLQVADPLSRVVPAPYRVRRRWAEAPGVTTLALEPATAEAALVCAPGQFTMLSTWATGEVPISVSGDPEDTARLVHTVRAVGLVTRALAAARVRSVVGVRGPFGNGWPLDRARGADVLIVAGGLGLAPLRSAVYALLRRRDAYGRVALLYGSRTPSDRLFVRELGLWSTRRDMGLYQTVDAAKPGWAGRVGLVTRLLDKAVFNPHDTEAFVCGPEIMMRFVARELVGRGVDPCRVHLSLERNMRCAVGTCGHCQLGPFLLCRDGPVVSLAQAETWLDHPEL